MITYIRYGVLLLLVVMSWLPTNAQPQGIHLSWNGKNVRPGSTMSLTWMDERPGKARVVYGTDSLRLDKMQEAAAKYVQALSAYMNKATIKRLKPATWYYYKVGSDANGWSKVYRFRTGPRAGDTGKIVVGIWSDTQNNKDNYEFEQTDTIVRHLDANSFYFTLHNGDIVNNGSKVVYWKGFFQVAQPINANHPFMAVTGNHDVVNDTASPGFQRPFPIFYEMMNLPGDQLNYSYNYGDVHFVAINSGWAEGASKLRRVLFAKDSPEYKWLESDLKKARRDKNIKWIILYSHYPVYSYGFSHIPAWQSHLKPLVDKYQVDLYLAGHRHVYERHKAIRGSNIFEPSNPNVYTNPNGTIYVTNGSCGGHPTGTGGHNEPTMIFTPRERIYTYAIMTIAGNSIIYNVFDKHGKPIDSFRILKEKQQ